jgi:hypothetical protein
MTPFEFWFVVVVGVTAVVSMLVVGIFGPTDAC